MRLRTLNEADVSVKSGNGPKHSGSVRDLQLHRTVRVRLDPPRKHQRKDMFADGHARSDAQRGGMLALKQVLKFP